jgi:Zn-dependent oligopeptidase
MNPLLQPGLPVPAFDRIKPEHFEPAVEAAIKEAREKAEGIKADPRPADFANTVVPLEALFNGINAIETILNIFYSSASNDQISEVFKKVSGAISDFRNDIFQDKTLAARFRAVYDNPDPSLNEQDRLILKNIHRQFEQSGALLDEAAQKRIKVIDQELIDLCSRFKDNLKGAAENQAVLFTDRADLAGLDEGTIDSFRENAKKAGHRQGWLFIPERLMVDSLLARAESRSFRERIFKALNSLGTIEPYDNRPLIGPIQRLRDERAKMLGYPHHAAFNLSSTMAGDFDRVQNLMKKAAEKILPKFEEEIRTLEKFSAANGGPGTLEPWDAPYWVSRYKEETFGYDANAYSEYLELENVLNGFFTHMKKSFQIEFHSNDHYPKWHEDDRTYDVTDSKTGKFIGVLHVDPYARPKEKSPGAWMVPVQKRGEGKLNVVSLNMNLVKPAEGQKTLVMPDDMETLFHEGGHAVHGLVGAEIAFESLQGPMSSSDFFEIHSMFQQGFIDYMECLKDFAHHYKTGEILPEEMLERKQASESFFKSRETLMVIQNSLRDFAVHTINPDDYEDDRILEKSVALDSPYADLIRPYPLARFSHLFDTASTPYAAGYYSYFWAGFHAAHAARPFREKGIYDPEINQKARDFYALGSSVESNKAYEQFSGGPATTDALLEEMGIRSGNTPRPLASVLPSGRKLG